MIYWVLGELQRRRCDVTNELSFEYQEVSHYYWL